MIEADYVAVPDIFGRAACDPQTGLLAAGQAVHRLGTGGGLLALSPVLGGGATKYGDVLACAGFASGDGGFAAVVLSAGGGPQLLWFEAGGSDAAEAPVALLPVERFSSVLAMAVVPMGNLAVVVGSDGEPCAFARGESRALDPPPPWLLGRPSPSPVLALALASSGDDRRAGGRWAALGTLSGALCVAHTTAAGAVAHARTVQLDGPISALLLHVSSSSRSYAVVGGAQGWVAVVRLPDATAAAANGESAVHSNSDENTHQTAAGPAVELLHRGLGAAVTALALHDVLLDGRAAVVAGTASGRVVALEATGAFTEGGEPQPRGDERTSVGAFPAEGGTHADLAPRRAGSPPAVWERDTLRPVLGLVPLGPSPAHGLSELAVVTAEGVSLQSPAPAAVAAKVATVAALARELAALRREARGSSLSREN